MAAFILKLEEKDRESLGAVRCMEGLMAAEADGYIWLKGINEILQVSAGLRQLPVKTTFIIDENNHLFIPGAVTPTDVLQEMQWVPLTEFIKVEPPVAAFPGLSDQKISIKLIPSAKERKGDALMTTLAAWQQYAETAPATRLQALEFAVSEKDEVLIKGHPLPPLPGKEYWQANDILVPAGYDFELSMMSLFISQKLNEKKNAVILFDTDGQWQRIEKEFFVKAKRSAVRLTKLNHD